MSMGMLIGMGWKSVLIAGFTLLLLMLLKKRSAAERSWIAHAGIAAILLLPLAMMAAPKWQVETASPIAGMLVPAQHSAVMVHAPKAEETAEPPRQDAFLSSPPNIDFRTLWSWLYWPPAVLLLGLMLTAIFRLALLRRRAEVLVEQQWLTALARAQSRMNFKHGTALLVSNELNSPVSWGLVRPVILLDKRAAGAPAQAEAVIAHEFAHVTRFDWAKLILGRIAIALFWFNPLVWMLARQCHELREEAADDAVLRSDVPSADYAALLLGAARHESKGLLLAANGVAPSRGSLKRRIIRVLDGSHSRGPAKIGWAAFSCIAMLGLTAPLSALTPVGAGDGMRATKPNPMQAMDQTDARAIPTASEMLALARAEAGDPNGFTARKGGDIAARGNIKTPADQGPKAAASTPSMPTLEAALVKASGKGDLATMNLLLANGISINSAVPGDGSPLIRAARSGRVDIAAHLLDRGANIDQGVKGDGNPLIAASAAGHLNMVRYLLDRGANIEAIVPGDENALMQASYHGHEDIARLLIARGANVNSRYGQRTPLSMARAGGHSRIERLLRDAGAGP